MEKKLIKSHLLEFYGIECDHCVDMEPLMNQIEIQTKIPIRRFEVWYNQENAKLLQNLDKLGACGGVPYFYNKKTGSWICGATTYANLKAWASGKPHERFLPPPKEDTEYIQGIRGWLEKIRDEGVKRMKTRIEKN